MTNSGVTKEQPPLRCEGDRCHDDAVRSCSRCGTPLCPACVAIDSHPCTRVVLRPGRRALRTGGAAVRELIHAASEQGYVVLGACVVEAESVTLRTWRWACACGVRGGWVGNEYPLPLVVANFVNRHAVCGLVVECGDQDDTSPVRVGVQSESEGTSPAPT